MFHWMLDYSWQRFYRDCLSGIVVGIIALPLAMAFAIASGVEPQYGIYTTIIAGFLISLLGGSRFQIGGPTGAFVPIIFGIVIQYGYENLLIAGFMAGIMLILLGMFKLGHLIHFIPRPVTIGFTAGIAVIIFSGQVPHFLGLHLENEQHFILKMKEIVLNLHSTSMFSILTSFICLACILIMAKYYPKFPGALVGLLASTLIATFFYPNEVATIGSMFQEISQQLPTFQFPELTWDKVVMLFMPAVAIALLGGVESLLSALVADTMTQTKHDSNRELVGQGVANVVTPLFGGIPATGAIARTATNIRQGATSPVAGMVHAVFVLLVLLLFAKWANHIPLASMAPILFVVAWNMSERKEFLHILRTKTGDSIVLCATFLLTVFTDLTIGVATGLGLAILFFAIRMSKGLRVQQRPIKVSDEQGEDLHICTFEGPIFFGSAKRLNQVFTDHQGQKILIICMHRVPYIDTTGEAIFSHLIRQFQQSRTMILVSGLQSQPHEVLKSTGLVNRIGENHFFSTRDEAISFAKQSLKLLEQTN